MGILLQATDIRLKIASQIEDWPCISAEFPFIFPVIGNLAVETGSQWTACSASQSGKRMIDESLK
jgi:hypothetical protein